jgi:pyruvate ferredoxin oxidoreductase gamma subunit
MREVVVYGRGGQGAVTAAQILAIAAFYDGKESQAFPNFGVERRGAPVQAYVRYDDSKINIRSQIYEPDLVVVLDSSLLDAIDVTKGLKAGGTIIINTKCPEEIKGFTTYSFDATSLAMKVFGKDIVNTVMVAAFSIFTKEIKEESIFKAVNDMFTGELAVKNKQIVEEAYNQLKAI